MNRIIGVLTLVITAFAAHAQQPAPDPDTLQNPVKQTDPEVKQPPADLHYVDEMERIATAELPPVVLDSLKKHEPTDWEKSVAYHDKRNKSYIVEVRNGGQERIYRFDTTGKQNKSSRKEQR